MPGSCPLPSRQPKCHPTHVNCHARGKKPLMVERYYMFWGVPQGDLQTFLSLLPEPHRGITEPLEIDHHRLGSQCGELSHPWRPSLWKWTTMSSGPSVESSRIPGVQPWGPSHLWGPSIWISLTPRACVHNQQMGGISELQGHLFIIVSHSAGPTLLLFSGPARLFTA